jgi:hypothetical protein
LPDNVKTILIGLEALQLSPAAVLVDELDVGGLQGMANH